MKRAVEIVVLVAFLALMAGIGVRVLRLIDGPEAVLVLFAAAGSSLLFTDLVSAVVHWFCDTCYDEETPVLGPFLIRPFREHHRDPLAMTRRGELEVNNSSAISVIPFLALGLWFAPPYSLFGQSWLLFFGGAVYLTNSIHKWAHEPVPSPGIRWLQRTGVILSPLHHRRHHARPTTAYGITTGWLNPALDRLRFFDRIARLVEALAPSARLPRQGTRSS